MTDGATQDVEVSVDDKMPDGTIYAGISPDTHKPIYTTEGKDTPIFTFNEAATMAVLANEGKYLLGYDDWRVPTKNELDVLFQNRDKGALKGTFDETASPTAASMRYWSSTHKYLSNTAWAQEFSNGTQLNLAKFNRSSLRLVRG